MTDERDFHNDVEVLRADMAALTKTVRKLANEATKAQAAIAKTVRRAGKNTLGFGEELWEEAGHLGHDAAGAAQGAAHAGVSSLESEIKRYPLSAIIAALGVGFVFGILRPK